MARQPLKGRGRIKRLMRQLPDAVRGEIVVELNVTGRQMRNAVLAKTPRRPGGGSLVAGIRMKVLPASLRLQIGLIGNKREREGLFYGRIQDLGRKAQIVTVNRYKRGGRAADMATPRGWNGQNMVFKASKFTTTYQMRVRAMPGKHFITGRQPELRKTLRTNLQGIFGRAIKTAAGGGIE